MTKQELQNQQAQVAAQLIATDRQLKVLNEQYDALTNALAGVGIGEAEASKVEPGVEPEVEPGDSYRSKRVKGADGAFTKQKTPPASVN